MIVVIGAAEFAVKIKMKPLKDEDEWTRGPQDPHTFDYSTLNVAAKQAAGDDIAVSAAGCGMNIATHLAELGQEVAFASVVGNDPAGLALLAHMEQAGIHTEHVRKLESATAIGVELLNILNDPQFAYANQEIYKEAVPELAGQWDPLLKEAEIIVMDGALPQETIEFIAKTYGGKDGAAIFFDPGSFAGTGKINNVLSDIHCIMPGRMEAEAMARRSVLSEEELMATGNYFTENGVSKVIITMKGGGLYYKEGKQEGILRPERVLSFANTSGAGDMVSAALVDAYAKNRDIEESAALAMERAAAFLADKEDRREL